jgi:6-phosphofructokinase 1
MARFAVLTSGGDAPGMNAVIYGVREEATADHAEGVGILEGFDGLAAGARIELAGPAVSPAMVAQSGTILRTSRRADLRLEPVVADCVASLSRLGIDGLVVIGGAGSLLGVERLRVTSDIPIAFVPATIDNDIEGSEETIGFDSAVNYGVAAVDSLRVTAESLLHRAFLVEVLGANCGRIADAIAASTPVDVLIVPERPLALVDVARQMQEALTARYAIAVMTEGCGEAGTIARQLGELMGARVRPEVLGHSQRAAHPTARDRRLGLACGRSAVSALLAGTSGDVVVRHGAPTLRPVRSPRTRIP